MLMRKKSKPHHKFRLLHRIWFIGSLHQRLYKKPLEWQVDICSGTPDRCIDHLRVYGTNNNNWGNFLQAVLTGSPKSGNPTMSLLDTTDTPRTPTLYMATLVAACAFYTGSAAVGLAYIQLGIGAGPAARADYAMATPIAGTANITAAWTNGGSAVTLTTTITYGSAQTPSELGLFIPWSVQSLSPYVFQFMLDHTFFAALASNTVFTILYTMAMA